jgi:cyclase
VNASARVLWIAIVVALLCVSLWGQPSDSGIPAEMTAYDTVKLADDVYAFIAPESNGTMVTGNSVVIIGDDGVLVVDSGHFPTLTARMIEQIKHWTDKPVRYLVNTHWHPDHNAGNGLYRGAFPGLQIVSTPTTRLEMETLLPKKEVSEETIGKIEDVLRKGALPSGSPLAPEQRKFYEKAEIELEAFRPELKKADHVLPGLTFKDELDIYLGKREVKVMFLGRGNTGGDAVIYVPDSKVLMTGDLLVYPIPYPFGSFIGEWIETLKKLQAIQAAIIVPGHGPVMHDAKYLDLTVQLLESTKHQVDADVVRSLSLEDTKKSIDLTELRTAFVGDDKERQYFFDHGYTSVAVTRAYREAKEGPLHDED